MSVKYPISIKLWLTAAYFPTVKNIKKYPHRKNIKKYPHRQLRIVPPGPAVKADAKVPLILDSGDGVKYSDLC